VDAVLPGGGLLHGALHEIYSPDPADGAATGFAVHLLSRFLAAEQKRRPALWASCRQDLFMPGFRAVEFDPGRVLFALCDSSSDLLSIIEEAIKSSALCSILADIGELDFSLSRRLQISTVCHSLPLVLIRKMAFASHPSAAATRWRAESHPGGWSLILFRNRSGPCGQWHWNER
jgi:protein ImuA